MTEARKTKSKTKRASAPWDRPAPRSRKRARKTLSTSDKARARSRAKRAGRPYPNMVDNMAVASTKRPAKRKAAKRKAARKTVRKTAKRPARKRTARGARARKSGARKAVTASKSRARSPVRSRAQGPASSRLRDPKGGLTAAGRADFRRRQGSHLKPGVKKTSSEMSSTEMRRKGSWAVRFYGRSGSLPPLKDAQGKPTRFALTAAAWGEPVPKDVKSARSIAAKGRRLLARAKKSKAQG